MHRIGMLLPATNIAVEIELNSVQSMKMAGKSTMLTWTTKPS